MTDTPADPDAIVVAVTFVENLHDLPDPNGLPAMIGEVLPDDWTPDGDR